MIPLSREDYIELSGGSKKALINTIITVMQEFGYDIETMRKMPVPTFFEIVRKLAEDQREMKRK